MEVGDEWKQARNQAPYGKRPKNNLLYQEQQTLKVQRSRMQWGGGNRGREAS